MADPGTLAAVRAAVRTAAVPAVLASVIAAGAGATGRSRVALADWSDREGDLELASRTVRLAATAAALVLVAGLLLVSVAMIARPDPVGGVGLAVVLDIPLTVAAAAAHTDSVALVLGGAAAVLLGCLVTALAVRSRMPFAARRGRIAP